MAKPAFEVVTINGVDYAQYPNGDVKRIASEAAPSKAKVKAQSFTPVEGSFKGSPTLQLMDYPFPFTIGLAKAQAALRHVDAIRAFVAKHTK